MDRIIREPGSQCIISRLSIVEIESVLAGKIRTGEINAAGVDLGRRCLRADVLQGRLSVGPPIVAGHYQAARVLLVKFGPTEGLRTLDALQLAVALDLRQSGLVSLFVAADQKLCRIASLAGCPSVNPEKPGPLVL